MIFIFYILHHIIYKILITKYILSYVPSTIKITSVFGSSLSREPYKSIGPFIFFVTNFEATACVGLWVEQYILLLYFHLAVVGSVQPGQPWTKTRLDSLESDLQHRFQCLQKHGGIGIRDETRRRKNGQ